MRAPPLLLVVALALAARAGESVVTSEEFNFSMTCPDNPDWTVEKIDAEKSKNVKAHFRTYFADTEPLADVDVQLLVSRLASGFDKLPLKKLASNWQDAFEGHLTGVRDRTEEEAKLGEEPAYVVDVKGDGAQGQEHRTWVLARMGKFTYVWVADRRHAAVGDKDIEAEVKSIRDSFKFLRKEKTEADANATGEAPTPGGAKPKKPAGKEIDPEKLKPDKIRDAFWRYDCLKPEGMYRDQPREDEKAAAMVLKIVGVVPDTGAACTIMLYADTDKSVKQTLEQYKEQNLKVFLADAGETGKVLQEDDKYKDVPLAKKALMWYAVKVVKSSVKERWILADCKNERQYRLRVFCSAGGDNAFKPQIEAFLKSFKPFEK